jgi:hypothetical protein
VNHDGQDKQFNPYSHRNNLFRDIFRSVPDSCGIDDTNGQIVGDTHNADFHKLFTFRIKKDGFQFHSVSDSEVDSSLLSGLKSRKERSSKKRLWELQKAYLVL